MPVPLNSGPVAGRRLLRDVAHDAIRDAILDGTLVPGERLDDKELQHWLGISRTPIRDALQALVLEGLVETAAQSFTRVASPEPENVMSFIQTLGVVFGGVTRIAVAAFTDRDRAALNDIADRVNEALAGRDRHEHLRQGVRLYELLLARCPNPALVSLARAAMTPMVFQIRITADDREPNWDMLEAGWERLRRAVNESDPVAAELAFEEMHLLPLHTNAWAPPKWLSEDHRRGL